LVLMLFFLFFFFSSRRRHTRSYGDWSSDVCSSDLPRRSPVRSRSWLSKSLPTRSFPASDETSWPVGRQGRGRGLRLVEKVWRGEVGRAACRERRWGVGGGGVGRKKEETGE